ncbi:MAG TPA: HEPN domain-containing protein [Panacibacter sp.]|nr:HEPN domain-containing protein [Panacibacter sp.]
MEKIKGKYEIVLGFVTLVISFSAFKDELSKFKIDIGFSVISVTDYFLWVVYGFCFSMYLYTIEHFGRDLKIGTWKIFDYILNLAYFLFYFLLASPILLVCYIGIYHLYILLAPRALEVNHWLEIIMLSLSILYTIISVLNTYEVIRGKKLRKLIEIEEQEIAQLDSASKLHTDNYFAHSIIETFKAFVTHISKKLLDKGVRIPKNNNIKLIDLAYENKILKEEDLEKVNQLRKLRNTAAHSYSQITQEESKDFLDFVKDIIKNN